MFLIWFLLAVLIVSALYTLWVTISSYLGNMSATFITLVVIATLLVIFNSFTNEPTKDELNYFDRQRRDKGR